MNTIIQSIVFYAKAACKFDETKILKCLNSDTYKASNKISTKNHIYQH
jgi:hypothetical protein